jgi:hypothetical protein
MRRLIQFLCGPRRPPLPSRSEVDEVVASRVAEMLGILAVDDPSEIEFDCRGDEVPGRCRIEGTWYDLMPVPPHFFARRFDLPALEEPSAKLVWRVFTQSTNGLATNAAAAGKPIRVQLEPDEGGGGVVRVRFP